MVKPQKITVMCIAAACFLVFSGFACSPSDSYIGKYQAIDKTETPQKEVYIELMENGEGSWTCCDGEVLFTWYVKNNELRINTKEGGIMVGKLKNGSFTIPLPGKKTLTFVKMSSDLSSVPGAFDLIDLVSPAAAVCSQTTDGEQEDQQFYGETLSTAFYMRRDDTKMEVRQ